MATLSVDTPQKKRATPTKWRYFLHSPTTVASVVYLVVLALIGILAPWIAPYDLNEINLSDIMAAPSAEHWLGTDDLGRDVVSRLMAGAGPSLFASLLAVSIGSMLGVPIGLLAGYAGGRTDTWISRVLDALLSFPAIVFAVGVAGVLGAGLVNGMLAVGILMMPGFARLTRATTMVVKQELYVDAIRAFGATPFRIITRHVLPNAIQSAVVHAGLLLAVSTSGRIQPQLSRPRCAAAAFELGRHAGARLQLHGSRAGADVCAGTCNSVHRARVQRPWRDRAPGARSAWTREGDAAGLNCRFEVRYRCR